MKYHTTITAISLGRYFYSEHTVWKTRLGKLSYDSTLCLIEFGQWRKPKQRPRTWEVEVLYRCLPYTLKR